MKLKDILKELDLPKGKYVEPTAKDIDDLKGDLYNLVSNAYKSIGGHLKYNNPDTMKDPNLKFWRVADLDADPEIDVVYFGKQTPFGIKHTGMGHDGERENIKNLLKKKSAELKNPGNYVEVSGAAFDSFVGKGGVPTIDSEEAVRKILGDKRSEQTEWHGKHPTKNVNGEGWYTRTIGGKRVTKIMIGKVK
tara:strand:+ start:862 stop:1437 length:576 start_codon:yes stop_codon:yes gene_type:complete